MYFYEYVLFLLSNFTGVVCMNDADRKFFLKWFIFSVTIAFCILLNGCAFTGLTPQQKSLAAGEEMYLQYKVLHQEYIDLYKQKETSELLRLKMRKYVAPALNKSKRAIVLYRDVAYLYSAFKKKPENYDRLRQNAQETLRDAALLMLQITNKDGE